MDEKPTVHVIDDDPAMRGSLEILLLTEGYRVRTYPLARTFLDQLASAGKGCVVTDVRMPDMSGLELVAKLREMQSLFPVIVMTAYADVPLAVEAMKTGAVDFIEKPFIDDALFAAVRAALAINSDAVARHTERQAIRDRLSSLTSRENDVLTGLLNGRTNKIIAFELGLSVRRVEAHRARIMEKMQANSLSELVRMALQANGGTEPV